MAGQIRFTLSVFTIALIFYVAWTMWSQGAGQYALAIVALGILRIVLLVVERQRASKRQSSDLTESDDYIDRNNIK